MIDFIEASVLRRPLVLSGGTGSLGGELLARLLEQDHRTVDALVEARARCRGTVQRVRASLAELTGDPKRWAGRVVAIPADLTRDGPRPQPAAVSSGCLSGPNGSSTAPASVSFTLGLPESRGGQTSAAPAGCSIWRSSPTSGGAPGAASSDVSTLRTVPGTHPGAFSEP